MPTQQITPETMRSSPAIPGMLDFQNTDKMGAVQMAFYVEFSVMPKVGEHLKTDTVSAKTHLKKVCYWTVVDVQHSIDLEPNKDDSELRVHPSVTLWVTVEPRKFTKAELRKFDSAQESWHGAELPDDALPERSSQLMDELSRLPGVTSVASSSVVAKAPKKLRRKKRGRKEG